MAEKRRLLNEMDKCFKKVDEGFEIFDEIMSKMSEANSDNQREKFQDDLKKEIKKLQRLRDQIKGWQNSSEIKDKEKLSHYRKLIEQRMETFKDIERENKTKPHSKQGLSAEDKLDPKEKEKSDAIEWLNNQIRQIQDEIDRTESKLESMTSAAESGGGGGGRKGRGKKDDKKNDKEKIEELKKHLERVKFHLTNLEVLLRLITNEKLDIKDVLTKVKEPIEMYIEALDPDNEFDPESLDPEDIYEELQLSSYIPQLGGVSIGSVDEDGKSITGENSGSPPAGGAVNSREASDEHAINGEAKGSAFSHSAPTKISSAATVPLKLMRLGSRVSGDGGSLSSPPPHTPPPPTPSIPYNTIAAGGISAAATTSAVSPPAATSSITPLTSVSSSGAHSPGNVAETVSGGAADASRLLTYPPHVPDDFHAQVAVSSSEQQQHKAPLASQTHYDGHPNVSDLPKSTLTQSAPHKIMSATTTQTPTAVASRASVESNSLSSPPPPSAASMPSVADPVVTIHTTTSSPVVLTISTTAVNVSAPTVVCSNSQTQVVANVNDLDQEMLRHVLQKPEERKTQPQTTTIPPRLGASPLGPVPITPELEMQRNMLESSVCRAPVQMDSEKPRTYLPKVLCQTPSYYPQSPPSNADVQEYYLRLSPETLFFIFYYMEGSRAQLLAAKALKKLSWRFHTKLMMWFQRHEEPKQITDDFEQNSRDRDNLQGTYVYFDYEKWVQRKREQFTFEYKYLEDKEFE